MNTEQDIRKKSPFKVPDGYFDSLTERTMSSIRKSEASVSHGETKPGRKLEVFSFLAIAAAIAGFALITAVFVRQVSFNKNDLFRDDTTGIFAEMVTGEIDTYLIEDEWSGNFAETPVNEEVSTEAIIDYLVMENIDIKDIYEIL